MEKYCKSCGRVFKDSDFKLCPYCGNQLSERVGRQPIPRKLRHIVFQRDDYMCRECGATNKQTRLHVDHIIPVAKGGTNDLSNLQTLCEACNRAKYTDVWVGGDNIAKSQKEGGYLGQDCGKDSGETVAKFQKEYEESLNHEFLRICPNCGKYVYYKRKICRHCQSPLPFEEIKEKKKIKNEKKSLLAFHSNEIGRPIKIYKSRDAWKYDGYIHSTYHHHSADSLYKLQKKVLSKGLPWEPSWIEY